MKFLKFVIIYLNGLTILKRILYILKTICKFRRFYEVIISWKMALMQDFLDFNCSCWISHIIYFSLLNFTSFLSPLYSFNYFRISLLYCIIAFFFLIEFFQSFACFQFLSLRFNIFEEAFSVLFLSISNARSNLLLVSFLERSFHFAVIKLV